MLLSCPPIIICTCYYCYMRGKEKQFLQQESPLSSPETTLQDTNTNLELQAAVPSPSSPSGAPGLTAAYTFTECPAYGQVPQVADKEFLNPVSIPKSSQLQPPEYEDTEELHDTGRDRLFKSPSGVAAYYSTIQCPANVQALQ